MVEAIFTIGISGSGKTTWARNQEGYMVLDSDQIRYEIYGDASCQDNPAKVFEIMYQRGRGLLRANQSVIFCSTNLSMKNRINAIRQLQNANPETTFRAVVLNVPLNICLSQNVARDRIVPEYVLRRQMAQFQMPVAAEGWDKIEIITPRKYDRVKFCRGVWKDVDAAGNQENPHHTLVLRDHLIKTIENLNITHMSDENKISMIEAAAVHDIGKCYTRSYDDLHVAHYYGHDNYGAYISMNMGMPFEVIQLVNYHMLPFNKQGISTWQARLGEELWNKIMILHDADTRAK